MPNPIPSPPDPTTPPAGLATWPEPYRSFARMVMAATDAERGNLHGIRLMLLQLRDQQAALAAAIKAVIGTPFDPVNFPGVRFPLADPEVVKDQISAASIALANCRAACAALGATPVMVIELLVTMPDGSSFTALVPETDTARATDTAWAAYPGAKSIAYVRSYYVRPGDAYASQTDGAAP